MTPARGAIRLTRAAMFSLSAVGLAVAAHAVGGEPVSGPVALALVPAVMLVVNLLAARRRGPLVLVLTMGVTQVALHAALMAAHLASSCRMAVQHPGGLTGSAHTAVVSASACDPAMAGHPASDVLAMSPRMFVAHAVSATLLALLLARGEAAFWALAGCLGFRLVLPQVPELPPARRPLPALVSEALLPQSHVPRRSVRRRGPPESMPVRLAAVRLLDSVASAPMVLPAL